MEANGVGEMNQANLPYPSEVGNIGEGKPLKSQALDNDSG